MISNEEVEGKKANREKMSISDIMMIIMIEEWRRRRRQRQRKGKKDVETDYIIENVRDWLSCLSTSDQRNHTNRTENNAIHSSAKRSERSADKNMQKLSKIHIIAGLGALRALAFDSIYIFFVIAYKKNKTNKHKRISEIIHGQAISRIRFHIPIVFFIRNKDTIV